MFKSLLRDRNLILFLALAILIRLFSLNEAWVERYYTYGIYPYISRGLRLLLGWIPFSFGDLAYIFAFIFLVVKAWKLIRLLARRQVKEYLSWILFRKYLKLVLLVYIVFNLFWGLNYDRLGIAHQLGLNVERYSREELFAITRLLQERVNQYAPSVDTVKRLEWNRNRRLYEEGARNFDLIQDQYPWLRYANPSIKSSLFSPVGHYFGFSGYFNPFSSEAQMNTTEPVFVKPFVVDHEIAHQLGYGKENEASFVSFLACRQSPHIDFRYSVYYELYYSALYECILTRDTAFVNQLRATTHPRVLADRRDELQFRARRKNKMRPYVSDFYDQYLKMNKQPKGLATYNEVIAWLIAYGRKFGKEGI
jgi:hypothetical protein